MSPDFQRRARTQAVYSPLHLKAVPSPSSNLPIADLFFQSASLLLLRCRLHHDAVPPLSHLALANAVVQSQSPATLPSMTCHKAACAPHPSSSPPPWSAIVLTVPTAAFAVNSTNRLAMAAQLRCRCKLKRRKVAK